MYVAVPNILHCKTDLTMETTTELCPYLFAETQISKLNKRGKKSTPTKRMIEYIHISQYKSVFWSNVCVGGRV